MALYCLFVQISSHLLVTLCRVNRHEQVFFLKIIIKKLNIVYVFTLVYVINFNCIALCTKRCLYSIFLKTKTLTVS